MKTYVTDSTTLSVSRIFTCGRLAIFVLGLLVLAATSMAEVTYDSEAGTFTGDGTFSEAVNSGISLTATPTSGQSITFTGNIVSTGNFTQSGADVVFGPGTVNSFNALYINNGSVNGAKMTLNGSMTLAELHVANVMTTFLDITDGAALSVSGKAWINEARSAQGIITQTGGTVSFTTSGATDVRIGHWPNVNYPSRYDISGGSLSVPNTTTYVGWDGYAEMNISGGEVSLKGLSLSNSANGKGTLRLTGGTLNVGDGGVVRNSRGASGPAAAEVYLGQGTINATANQTWGNNLTMTLTGRSATDSEDVEGGVTTFNADEGKAITIPSVISGVGALTKTGAGTLTLSGANTYSGGTTVTAGTLKLTNSSTTGTGTTTVASGATLEIAAPSTAWTWSGGTINGNGTLKVTGGNLTMPFANMGLGTDGKIVVDGANFTIDNKQSATVYYKGVDIDINNGSTVTIKRSGSSDQIWLQNEPVITFDVNGGGTFNTGTSLNLVNNSDTKFVTNGGAKNIITGAAGFNLHSNELTFEVAKGTDASGVDLEVSARLWNGHGIIKKGAGTMALTYANPYQGGTTISAGTLALSGAGTMGTGAVSIAAGATLTFADGLTATTIPNAISGAGMIVKEGNSTVSINGTNTFTGDAAINGGTLSFLMNGTNRTLNVAKISGAGDLELRISTGAGNILMPNLTLDNFSGKIALVNNDCTDSSKFYTNRRTFEGFTFAVNPGTTIYVEYAEFMANVLLAGGGNREGYGALRINDNMSGKITVTQDALLGINGSRTVSGDITSGAASGEVALKIQTNTNNVSQTISGNISDGENSALGLSIIKKQNGTFTFTGSLTYTGATSVAEGQTMALSGANTNLLHSRAVDVNGTLNFTGYTGTDAMQLNDLTGTNGTITGTGKNLKLFNDETTKFIGSITAAAITKTGEGTLKLDGTVTASSLTVTGGELDLKGSTTGGLTISNAVFSPGNSVGAAEVGGAFTLTDGASVILEIGGSAPSQNDSLVAAGNLELNDGKIYLTLAQACDLKPGDEFTAVFSGSNSASIRNNFIDNYVVSQYFTNLQYVPYGDGQYAITGILDPNAVPEPSAWVMLLLGALGMMFFLSPRFLTRGRIALGTFLAVLLVGSFAQADETQRWIPGVSGSISNASVWENGTALPEGGTGYIYDGVQTITDTSLSGHRTLEFTGGTTSFLSNVNVNSSGFTVKGGTLNTYQISASGATFNVSGGVWNNGSERIALNGSSTMTLSGSGVLNFKGCYYLNGRDSKGFTVQSGDSVLNLNSVWLSNTAGGWFQIGENTGARGSKYDLHSGTINLNSGEFRVSHGTFTQSGGVFNMSNGSGIVLTDDTDSVFNLSGGTFNMNGAGYINAALGTFNVTGGSINVTPTATDAAAGKKIVGIFRDEATAQNVLSYMTMADGWTAGVVTANNQTMILAGQGAVPEGIKIWKADTTGAMSDEANWEGMTADTTGYVFSGTNRFTDFSGNLIINGGVNTINTPSNDQTPAVTAGQMLVYNGGDNTLGTGNLTSNGSVYINDGRVKVGNNLRIYGTEADVSYLEVNGTLNVSRWLAIAQGASTSSTAKVVINGGIVYCGSSGAGGLIVGDGTGANGELELNGGTLQVTNGLASNFANAENSVAKFTMTGGTYTTAGVINIGTAKNAKATVDISGGELKSTGTISIGTGSGAKGAVTISGGEVTALRVKVGRKSAGDDAKLTITGGKLIVTQDICGSDSAASGCVYVSDSGQIVLNSTYTAHPGIRELTKLHIAGAGDGTGALRFLKSLAGNVPITLTDNATIGIDPGATFTQSATFAETQASALTITGGGTLALSAASSFTGGTVIDSSAVILSGAGTLGTGNITLNDGSLMFNGVTSSIASNISGTGDLTVSSGTATLTGTVTQTAGATTLANGTTLNFASGTLNDLAVADDASSAALNVTGDLTLNNDGNTKFIGPITAASITKTGEGTLKLNTGSGTITASNVTVTGGRLDLLGKTTGGLTISGAVFSPGNSVGSTTITDGGFSLSDGASVIMEIGGSDASQNDSLVASGALNLDGGKIYLTFADACDLKPGDEFKAVFSGSNSESLKNNFIDDYVISYYFKNLDYVPYGDGQYAITGILDPNAVPEPASWTLLILGAFGLIYFRKRK